jgi:phosphomannomutase/phosphoglucomutase
MDKEKQNINFNSVIFRAYDIRGVFGDELTCEVVSEIAKAIGTIAHQQNQRKIVVGRDGRVSSPELNQVLIEGLLSTGINVTDIGIVPTPVTYFASHHLETNNCVMITGSHNAAEYNGLKTVIAGNSLFEEGIEEIKKHVVSKKYIVGRGTLRHVDISTEYIQRILDDIDISAEYMPKIVIDCGNGSAGEIAPRLFEELGCNFITIFSEIDGSFPNHHPDPSQPINLEDLVRRVKKENADIGFAFDGDGDRLGVVDAAGNIIWPDKQLMLLAIDVLSRNKGSNIIYDVKCTKYLKSIIECNHGKSLMWKTGHSFIKQKMNEVDAPLAGEMSGHIFFKERWYGFDDALYTAARFVEIFSKNKKKPTELFEELPYGVSTPELRMFLKENEHINFMKEFSKNIFKLNAEIINIDGLRVEYDDGWGLVRPSNTSPYIIFRFEADNESALKRIQIEFRNIISSFRKDAKLPF